MADWLNLDPPPVGVNMTPLYVTNADFHYPDDPWNHHNRECGASSPGYWTWHGDTRDLMVPCTCGGPTDPVLAGPDPWLEQDAEFGQHVPWCGIHFSEPGVCTENCKGDTHA